uniref:Ig-like domain-containing protein n=1 Tax=Spermophilus dauricus TaxID=99837 RepID=A0A8C9Q9A9_SPEDA
STCPSSLPRSLCLCLSCSCSTQRGALPRPSISAEPGSVIPQGRPVTIVCRVPAGAQDFRLEKEGRPLYLGKRTTSPSEQEARFLFRSMSEDTAGCYHCLYLKSTWSELSEELRLVSPGPGLALTWAGRGTGEALGCDGPCPVCAQSG